MQEIDFYVSGINRIIRRACNSQWHTDNIYYKTEYVLVITLSGEATYFINGESVSTKKNDVLLFSPKHLRSGKTDINNPWEFISIIFQIEQNDAAQELLSVPYLHFCSVGDDIRSRFVDAAYSWQGKPPLYSVKCSHIVLSILYDLVCTMLPHNFTPHFHKIEAAHTFIQANFKKQITVEDLANRLGLSVSYFRKLFRQAYGLSPMQYITNLRIHTARDLLLTGEVNVTEAAQLSGFDDIYYFSKLFKKHYGCT